jgi:hypothetical protein
MADRPRKAFERRWTAEQQTALAHAMLDARPRLTAKEASKAAMNGTLPGAGEQLEPFGPVPISTCHHIRRTEINGREVQARGRLAKAGHSANAVAIVLNDSWTELDRAREQVRVAKMSGAERAKALREIALTAQTIARVERDLTGERPSKQQPESKDAAKPERKQRTEADDLARAARKRAQTEHTSHPSTQATQRETEPGTDRSSSEDATEHATDSQERVRSSEGTQLARSLAQTAA